MKEKEFHTVRGYYLLQKNNKQLTSSMEDYLEMIYRLSKDNGFTRINNLSKALNVKPPSASKMVHKLAFLNYINFEKYGIIQLTKKGERIGNYLIKRHKTIETFLKLIGVSNGILEETEKIEHTISEETLGKIEILVNFLIENDKIKKELLDYKENMKY